MFSKVFMKTERKKCRCCLRIYLAHFMSLQNAWHWGSEYFIQGPILFVMLVAGQCQHHDAASSREPTDCTET